MPLVLVRPDILYGWKGGSLLILNLHGACGDDQPLAGYYFEETRFVRTVRLEVNGKRPWTCESAMVSPDCVRFTFVHPEMSSPGGGGTGQSGDDEQSDADGLPERGLEGSLDYRVSHGSLALDIRITNRSRQTVTFELGCCLGADYADIQEALGGRREQQAPVDVESGPRDLTFVYRHDQLPFRTRVRHDGEWSWGDGRLVREVTLGPREARHLPLRVVADSGAQTERDDHVRHAAVERWQHSFTRIECPGNRIFEAALACNVRDAASFPLLSGAPDEWLALQAGVPLYPALFGRDAITAGWQVALIDRGASLDAALARIGRLQSARVDAFRDEEPGRVPYQVRSGPLARLDVNPYSAYYADFASPLMFVISLANLYAWTGDRAQLQRHWDTARRILDWARDYGDADRDGYLEYQTRSPKGTKNQGWKDSGDAIVYDDGRPVPTPIATCELQGYWYLAQQLMSALSLVSGAKGDARAYLESARRLKKRFNEDWWVEDEGFVALALDPDKQPVRAVTSNVGHCLACGIVARERIPAVVGRMFAPDMFSGWGIRTLSSRHAYYAPLSYHRGSVWAVEQATILFGLVRYGFTARAHDLASAIFELSQLYPDYRIPECVGGFSRSECATPGAYPRANTPQLWNATAFPLLVQGLLGIVPLAPADTLIVNPILPAWLPEIVVRDVRVGRAKATLRFWRDDAGASRWEVLHKSGRLHVLRQPPPEAGTMVDRLKGTFESLVA